MNAYPITRRALSRRGITLVELMVAMLCVAILVAISLGALNSAAETARERRTQALIKKLDQALMARWDSYRTRRIPVVVPTGPGSGPKTAAVARLLALRELMRYEMPEWDDVDVNLATPPAYLSAYPSLLRAYKRRYDAAKARPGVTHAMLESYKAAECLYMIVTMGDEGDFSSIDHFREKDIGDADGDSLPEFHDGWGRPILFIRWAPGVISDLQRAIAQGPDGAWGVKNVDDDGANGQDDIGEAGWPGSDDTRLVSPVDPNITPTARDQENNHDPFDPLRVDMPSPSNSSRRVFRLFPFIYSAGPDGVEDIVPPAITRTSINDPYLSLASGVFAGAPYDFDVPQDGLNSYDNITNHQVAQWVR